MIDRGADWLHLPKSLRPDAIVLTHAHADHAYGLASGADCPVLATAETLALLARFPVADGRPITPRKPFFLGAVRFEAISVEHSVRAPAVGYRVSAAARSFFYVPDVAAIPERRRALHGAGLYIGDGATMVRSMVRRQGSRLIGHAPIRSQLVWCAAEGVRRAIFTHCGTGIVGGDGRKINSRLRRLARDRGIDARLAHDGLRISFDA